MYYKTFYRYKLCRCADVQQIYEFVTNVNNCISFEWCFVSKSLIWFLTWKNHFLSSLFAKLNGKSSLSLKWYSQNFLRTSFDHYANGCLIRKVFWGLSPLVTITFIQMLLWEYGSCSLYFRWNIPFPLVLVCKIKWEIKQESEVVFSKLLANFFGSL